MTKRKHVDMGKFIRTHTFEIDFNLSKKDARLKKIRRIDKAIDVVSTESEKDDSTPVYYDSEILLFINHINKQLKSKIKQYTQDFQSEYGKRILQLYSGGRDSTYLLLKNLEDGYDIDVQYNIFNPSDNKYVIINKFIFLWNMYNICKKYPNRIRINYNNVADNCCVNMVLSQQPFNIYSLALGMRGDCEIKECQMGLISQDCGLSYIDELKSLYKSAMKFTHYYEKYNKIPPLKFPLIKKVKLDILNKLSNNSLSKSLIYNTCSSPIIQFFKIEKNSIKLTISECEHCDTCEHLEMGMLRYHAPYASTSIQFSYHKLPTLTSSHKKLVEKRKEDISEKAVDNENVMEESIDYEE